MVLGQNRKIQFLFDLRDYYIANINSREVFLKIDERKLEFPSDTVSFELRPLMTVDYFFQVKKY